MGHPFSWTSSRISNINSHLFPTVWGWNFVLFNNSLSLSRQGFVLSTFHILHHKKRSWLAVCCLTPLCRINDWSIVAKCRYIHLWAGRDLSLCNTIFYLFLSEGPHHVYASKTSGQGELRGKKRTMMVVLYQPTWQNITGSKRLEFCFLVLNMQRVSIPGNLIIFACNTQYLQKPMTGNGSTRVA